MTRRLLITGTDTGVGKTQVTAGLAARLRSAGLRIAVAKPFLSGTADFVPGDPDDDAATLSRAAGVTEPAESLTAFRLRAPLSPLAAARLEGIDLELPPAAALLDRLAAGADVLLVEGVGGIRVPLWPGFTVVDFARALDLPVLVVARPGLGTINHTLLTIDAARSAGVPVTAFVISLADESERETGAANAEIISAESGITFAGFLDPVTDREPRAWAAAAAGLDMDAILPADPATGTAASAAELDRQHLWHPFTQMEEWLSGDPPLVIAGGEGSWLIDTDGRRLLDGVSSLWCNVHGHRHPRITAAIHRQLDRVAHSTMLGLTHAPAARLAEALVRITPSGLTRVFYSDAGATAVEVALRMAIESWERRGQSQRTGFVSLADAYHGDTIGSVSLGASEVFHRALRPLLFPVHKFIPPHLLQADGLSEAESVASSLAQLRALLETHADQLAACLIEPRVQGAAGIWVQPPGFLAGVERLCREFGVLLICDEVATGFGRTGFMFACDSEGVCPDLMTLGKGLSGGYLPLAATLATEAIFDAFGGDPDERRAFYHGHTFTGNPLGCVAAIASLEAFAAEDTLARGRRAAAHLEAALAPLSEYPAIHGQRGLGLMRAVDLRAPAGKSRFGHRVAMAAREHGVIIRPLGDTLVVMPPLTISDGEIDILANAIGEAITACVAGP